VSKNEKKRDQTACREKATANKIEDSELGGEKRRVFAWGYKRWKDQEGGEAYGSKGGLKAVKIPLALQAIPSGSPPHALSKISATGNAHLRKKPKL